MPPTYQATQEVAGLIFSGPWTPSVSSSAEGGRNGPVMGALLCFPRLKLELASGPSSSIPLKSSWASILCPLQSF